MARLYAIMDERVAFECVFVSVGTFVRACVRVRARVYRLAYMPACVRPVRVCI